MSERLADGTPFGPYTIEGLIAGGGMGQVYAARHTVYGSAVALKVLHPNLHADEGWRARFNEEGLVGTQLKHPHVLSARELVHNDGRIALVVDLVPGGQTLEKVISREFRDGLALVPALNVFLKILQGMDYLHGKGIVHGDLKPENVMIEGDFRKPENWMPKVADFGTVALIANPVEIDGRPAVVATPRYASPEHLYGVDKIEARSDVYCLGLLLHFLLTGRHASNAQTVREAAERVLLPVPIVTLVDQPEALIQTFKKATAIDPDDRYDTARELALAVRAALESVGATLDQPDVAADLATEVDEDRVAQRQAASKGKTPPRRAESESQAATEMNTPAPPRELGEDRPKPKSTPPGSPPRKAASPASPASKKTPAPAPVDERRNPAGTVRAPNARAPASDKAPPTAVATSGPVPWFVWVAGGIAVLVLVVVTIYAWPG